MAPGCGDGVVGPGEQCDDGNFDNTDGCIENCRFAVCGDGLVRASVESCDDGNQDEHDGCTSACGFCPSSVDAAFYSATTEHCYTWNSLPNRFGDANQQCVVQGGQLVSFATSEEHAEVTAGLAITDESWIGLENSNSNGWRWVDGTSEQFTNRAEGFPDGNTHATQLPNGEWQSLPDDPHALLCELKPYGSAKIRPEDNHAYIRFGSELSWEVAHADCQSRGGYLAVISSPEEAVFVRSNVGSDGWIGLSDAVAEGEYVWVTGEPFEFSDWSPNRPNGGATENCVLLGARWEDLPCADSRPYFCEFE